MRNILGVEFETGYGYVAGELNKTGWINAGNRDGEPEGRCGKIDMCRAAGIRVRPDGR